MRKALIFSFIVTCVAFFASFKIWRCVHPAAGPASFVSLLPQDALTEDSMNFGSLKTAVERSLHYYGKQNPETEIHINNRLFTVRKLSAAYKEFLEMYRRYSGNERYRRLGEKFELINAGKREGVVLFTGYYEDAIEGSAQPTSFFDTPLLLKGRTPESLAAQSIAVIVNAAEKITVKTSAIKKTAGVQLLSVTFEDFMTPVCWVNGADLYFLQIEGTGVVDMAGPKKIHIAYESVTGPYFFPVAGKFSGRCGSSKNAMKRYLRTHPEYAHAVLVKNPARGYFHTVRGKSRGSLNEVLVPGRSAAGDPDYFPKGVVGFAIVGSMPADKSYLRRFICIQDTGAKLKGPSRLDLYFGAGKGAAAAAENYQYYGRFYFLVPR